MTQLLASILFFIVFIQLFIVLSIYLGVTIYAFFKKERGAHILRNRTITTQQSAIITKKEEEGK